MSWSDLVNWIILHFALIEKKFYKGKKFETRLKDVKWNFINVFTLVIKILEFISIASLAFRP